MDPERTSLSASHKSDYSQASNVSLGPSLLSVQADNLGEERGEEEESEPLVISGSESRGGTSWYASVFLVVNAALGAGLLDFPSAYHQSGGLVVGITVQLVLGIFIIGSMIILIYCAQIHSSATYQDVVYTLCGKSARVLCSAIVALYAFGTCVMFFIIIGDQWDKFLSFIYPEFETKWFLDRKFTITLTCVAFVLPLCFPRRIDFLKYVSALGVIAVLYCVILVTVKYFVGTSIPARGYIRTRPDNLTDVFMVIPVICFGYQCHLSLVPIYACTRNRSLSDFSKTIFVALMLCFLTYTLMASLGYLTFGSAIKPDILLCYTPTVDVLIAVIGIALKMYTTYPILLFVGRAALDSVWMDIMNYSSVEMVAGEKCRRIIATVVWFVVSLLLALFVPDIGIVISLLGGLAAIFIFGFPGLCLLQLLLQGYLDTICFAKQAALFFTSGFCLVLCGFIFGLVTTQTLWSLYH